MEAILSRTFTPARLLVIRQFIQFGTVGLAGFVTDTSVVYALRGSVGLYVAGAIAYVVAVTVTWGLNRIWTFRGLGGGPMHRQWALFLAANGMGFVLNRGTYFILVTVSPLCVQYPVLAIFAGVVMGMFMNFHMSRKIVFR
jgi:putative flippase GtrA